MHHEDICFSNPLVLHVSNVKRAFQASPFLFAVSWLTGFYRRGNIFICHPLSQYWCKRHLIRLMNHQTPLVWINRTPVKCADIIFHGAKERNSADRTAVFSLYFKKRKKNTQKEQHYFLGLTPWLSDLTSHCLPPLHSKRQPCPLVVW